MQPTEPGRYLAQPTEWGVNETGQNKLLTFVCKFALNAIWQNGDWVDCTQDGLESTGYFYLMMKNGQPNTFNIDSLKDSLGWDGASVEKLNDLDWSQTEVQLTLNEEEYQGKKKIKVAFINHRDAQAGVQKADPQQVRSLDQKYGPMLRAISGNGVPSATKAPAKTTVASGGKKAAWDEFLVKWNEYLGEHPEEASNRDKNWKALVSEHFGARDVAGIKEPEWRDFSAAIKKDYSPVVGGMIPI